MKQLAHKLDSNREGLKDTNDCTVRALKNAYGISYKDANAIAEKAGRKKGKGHFMETILRTYGKAHTQVDLPCAVTLEKFLDIAPDKTVIVRIHKHVMVVKDKVVLDHKTNKASKLVYKYWVIGKNGFTDCPFKKLFKGFKIFGTTQESIIFSLKAKGFNPSQISEMTGIQISNVSHFYSKIKSAQALITKK